MSLLPFSGDFFDCRGLERAPVFFVTDYGHVRKQRTGWTLLSTALHKFAEIQPNLVGELCQVLHNVRVVGCDVCAFRLVCPQIVQDRLLQIRERFVLIPERQLLLTPRKMKFPRATADRLKILAVVVVERLVA